MPLRDREIAEVRIKGSNVRTHNQLVKKFLRRPGVRTEIERIECEESALLEALLKAGKTRG
jgi:hypothetical protein